MQKISKCQFRGKMCRIFDFVTLKFSLQDIQGINFGANECQNVNFVVELTECKLFIGNSGQVLVWKCWGFEIGDQVPILRYSWLQNRPRRLTLKKIEWNVEVWFSCKICDKALKICINFNFFTNPGQKSPPLP